MRSILPTVYSHIKQFIQREITSRSSDPDIARRELVLNTIMSLYLAMLAGLLPLATYYYVLGSGSGNLLILIACLVPFLCAFIFWRKNKVTLASWTIIGFFSTGLLYSAIVWGVILPMVILGIAAICVCTSILISSRAGFIFGISAITVLFIVHILHISNILTPDMYWVSGRPVISDFIEYSILILFILGISWLSNQQMESALTRAKSSEENLRIERDQLEIRVVERTKEIEELQIEKTTAMYHFVEFGKLSSGLIHDLMSPLTTLCMNPQQNTDNAIAQDSIIQASRKIQDIIGATRNQIKMSFDVEILHIDTLINQILLLHRSRLIKNNIRIEKSFDKDNTHHVLTHTSLVQHILTNLISNAIDAIEEKHSQTDTKDIIIERQVGEPTNYIDICCVYEENPSINTDDISGNIKITVSDSGAGIKDIALDKIFDPFFSTKAGKGCGYGLSASRHIARKYLKGDLVYVPNPTHTTFKLTFPAHIKTL